MSDFDLYYWPVPFRGQFIRGILAYGDCSWDEHGFDEIEELMGRDVEEQPIAFMGPPVLIDHHRNFAVSQMSAIAIYLGERLELLPSTAEGRALTAKIVNDANDVIDELTLNGGREMWTHEKWKEFIPRLQKWLCIFQDTGERHGLKESAGFMLGTEKPGVADIVTAILWATMADRFAVIKTIIQETSPIIGGLSKRVQAIPTLAALNTKSFNDYGLAYCGGEIEKSLRTVAT
ncbi:MULTISPECIES: glutathione S-transferase [unclassified Ochrobactrum]|uniref:glutathione S-transferase n=1 Tax=unclassified Ochrobactrum TaxID=239106 RepID=UPI0015FC01B0|nr:glutathione S-transferase [Ochrobactrum sp. RH2CCR150]MDH7788678.1 glutathione S-transferase [Ochrobactrum sp. 19YEA23]